MVAPGAFAVLASRDQAGAMVGYSLGRMHWMGVICGVAILLLRLLRTRNIGSLAAPAALCIAIMLTLTVISQLAVSPKMAALRMQMGSIAATAAGNRAQPGAHVLLDKVVPLLAEFGRLHAVSVGLESGVLLAGMAALVLMVREMAA